jgi:hypothetical protein
MTAALACSHSLRAVAPRRANCRGFGPGSFIAASSGVHGTRPACNPLPGVGSKEDPASLSIFNRLTINSACQPKDVNGRSIRFAPLSSSASYACKNSMGMTDNASIARG